MQSTNERTQSRKRKNDTKGDASNMLDEQTMKQLKTSGAQQVGYNKHIQPLSEVSHEYTDFFGLFHHPWLEESKAPLVVIEGIILKFH
jgi:hypothetical protein